MRSKLSRWPGLTAVLSIGLMVVALASDKPASVPEEPLRIRTVTIGQMKFPDAELGEIFRHFDTACNKAAQPGWHRRPYSTFEKHAARGVYFGEWANFSDGKGRNPLNYWGPKPVHCFELSAYFDADSPDPVKWNDVVGVRLDARWKPAQTGWAAWVTYASSRGKPPPRSPAPLERFEIAVQLLQPDGSTTPSITLDPLGAGWFTTSASYAGIRYEIVVSATSDEERQRISRTIPDAEIRQLLKSPESLRDASLSAYAKLLKKIEADLATGKAVRSARVDDPNAEHRGQRPADSSRPLSAVEQQQLLAKARSEIGLKTDLIREHYRDMHAALEKAFPLYECLRP